MALVYGLHRISDPTIRYVGLTTKTIKRRFYEHNYAAKNGKMQPLYKWMRKYEDITYTILADNLTKEEAISTEIELIAFYNNLLNCTNGGEGLINPSIETRARMSAAKKGKPVSAKAIEAARIVNTGRKMPPEFGEKSRQRLLGTKLSVETRKKISDAAKGRIAHNKGKSPSEEIRLKMSIAQKNRNKMQCPHCLKQVDPGNARQWHFDKCKLAI